jgi:hypothetical protein
VLAQDGTVAAQNSKITAAQMPRATVRVLPESVPAEFNQAFDSLLKQGAGKISGGDREVLALTGNYKSAANVSKSISQMETNFRNAGWKYESQGQKWRSGTFHDLQEDRHAASCSAFSFLPMRFWCAL